jgi:hypothetical protein
MIDPAAFAKHIGTDFTVGGQGGPVLRLTDVKDHGVANGMHQFWLLFHGPGDRLLPQEIHAFAHPVLGTHDIFVVPVQGSTAARILYQACFAVPA